MLPLNILFDKTIGVEPNGLDFQNAFNDTSVITIAMSIGISLIYYLIINRWKPGWEKMNHWLITMLINGILCFAVAYLEASLNVEGYTFNFYVVKFGLFNMLFGSLVYFLTSVIAKRWSIFAQYTPFQKP